jgi:hypothetical protein
MFLEPYISVGAFLRGRVTWPYLVIVALIHRSVEINLRIYFPSSLDVY